MPSAPAELQDKFPGMDSEAIEVLEKHGWSMSPGFIWSPPAPTYKPSQREWDAIDYLIQEWDYGYAAQPVPKVGETPAASRENKTKG